MENAIMRIIYGVSGEGSGHSSRAKEMVTHLLGAGHEVQIVSYNRGYETLHKLFPCHRIDGLRILSVDNKVTVPRTLAYNLRMLPAYRRSIHSLRKLFDEFQPDLVITDFEPMCARFANWRKLPLISRVKSVHVRAMRTRSSGCGGKSPVTWTSTPVRLSLATYCSGIAASVREAATGSGAAPNVSRPESLAGDCAADPYGCPARQRTLRRVELQA